MRHVCALNEFLGDRSGVVGECLDPDTIEAFLSACGRGSGGRGARARPVGRVRCSVKRFQEYLASLGHEPRACPPAHPPEPLLEDYVGWMEQVRQSGPRTRSLRRRQVRHFLHWLGPQASPEGLSQLARAGVEQFSLDDGQGKGESVRRNMQSSLSTFLQFAWDRGLIDQPLHEAIPHFQCYSLARTPEGLTPPEAQAVLDAVDRDTDVGRRDYAILQLLQTYGVRAGQVAALRLDEIEWERNRLTFRAVKEGQDSVLPLTVAVGESLLDYLQQARARSAHARVFLTCRAPSRPLGDGDAVSAIVKGRLRAAGIDRRGVAAHAFRHGWATQKLAEGYSLKEIADVLGHRQLRSTFVYTKVDFQALRPVGLAWPGEVHS